MRKVTPPKERFTRHYRVDKTTGCWIWIGGNNGKYPTFGLTRSKQVYAHRFSYETFVATIPNGLEVDHQCNNKLCVNPDHLKPMTHRENSARLRKTHCHLGHAFDKANTWIEKNGQRHCRECHRLHEAARKKTSKMMLQAVPDLETVSYKQEGFPVNKMAGFDGLFHRHGMEVRGRPFHLHFQRYHEIQMQNRLVWIVARSIETSLPIGYACSFWYRDLHFDETVAADDLWFVDRGFRKTGIGKTVKVMCHAELKKAGVVRVYDTIRSAYNHPTLMQDLGFEIWGNRWQKTL